MAKKINKQYSYTAKGEKKLNCYKVTISKHILQASGINENDEIEIYAENNKIIIEKAN